MGILFRPDAMIASLNGFDAGQAAERGVSLVFSDLDNTLTRWNDATVPPQARAFAARLRARNIDLCLVSNNSEARIKPFAQALQAGYIAKARKPMPFAMQTVMRRRHLSADRCVMLGDQLITDILAGNLAGVQTCLVKPIDLTHEYRGTKINRRLESILFALLGLRWEDEK